jgi:hypothetical protein
VVSILTGRDTDFRKWSVEWPTNVWQRCFANFWKKLLVLKFFDHSLPLTILSLSAVSQSSLKDFSNSPIAILLQSKYIRCPSQGNYVYSVL